MFLFFFMTRWLMFVNLWNERVHLLMIVYDCDLQKISRWAPKFPKRTAKDPPKDRKMHWAKSTSHPAKSPCLWPHFYGENLSFSSAFHSSILFLFLSPSPDGPMRCVKRQWANSLPTPDLIFLIVRIAVSFSQLMYLAKSYTSYSGCLFSPTILGNYNKK